MRVTEFSPELEAWVGPFDLLCTVLLRRELPITDVELAEVALAYVRALDASDEDVDPDTVSEFLLLVAGLCEIKVRELLSIDDPVDLPEPVPGESLEQMLERLLAYQTFRGAADWLGERAGTPRYWRVAPRPVIRRTVTYDGPTFDPAQLAAALNVLLAEPNVDVRHLVGRHATVREMAERLLSLVLERGTVDFDEAITGCSRLDQAVAFVAVLEMARTGQLHLAQPDAFGAIAVSPTAEAATTPIEVDEYDGADPEPTETQIA